MGIGGGTGVGGTAQPPQIRESETTAFVEGMKKFIAMVPGDTLEVIPFTQREYEEVFKYRSEPDRPLLHPLLNLRFANVPEFVEEETWQPIYDDLVKNLPTDIKNWFAEEMEKPLDQRDIVAVVLNQLLEITAKGIGWLMTVTQPVPPNSPAEAYMQINAALPYFALEAILFQAQEVLDHAKEQIALIGPNDPNFNALTNLINEMTSIITELNDLKKEIEG